ncbi:MAG: lycopene cyclase domain-containing protein [Patescibacteria group bacterium]
MQWFYLIGLLIGIGGLVLIDRRWKLGFWRDAGRTAKTLATAVAIFALWDLLGISLGIFFHGGSQYSLPYRLAPEFPIEEIVFLFLLSYSALIIYHGVQAWRSRTS